MNGYDDPRGWPWYLWLGLALVVFARLVNAGLLFPMKFEKGKGGK